MALSEAKKRANAKYDAKTYQRINLLIRKDEHPNRAEITEAADVAGESLNGYIKQAIRERMERGY